ncbi:alpha/beta hydrolase [Chitinimonas sp.]|uniref:alpha/beta fold hydrolase n=1 Tax=Chitinimonas sp. TaxID=1934313 RepID=UPI002F92E835
MTAIYRPIHPYRSETVLLRGMPHRLCRWGRPDTPKIVLLHGWMDCAATFQFLVDAAPAALREYDLLALDWRGFGQSAWAEQSYYFPDYLADLDALLTQYAPDQPATLLGHSMGGIVACLYAGIRPERVAQVVSLEGFGLPATEPGLAPARYRRWLDEVAGPAAGKDMQGLATAALQLQKVNPRLAPEQARWLAGELAIEQGGQTRYRADPRHKWVNPVLYRLEEAMACWREVQAPTTWVVGDETRLLQWLKEDADQFAERRACFRQLRYLTLPDCGHNLQHDAPAAVAELLLEAVRQRS